MKVDETKRFETAHEFCKEYGLSFSVEYYLTRLNNLWIKEYASLTKGSGKWTEYQTRGFLEEEWNAGQLTVRGVYDWIIDLTKAGVELEPVMSSSNGTAIVFESEARDKLMNELGTTYHEILIASLKLDTVARQYAMEGLSLKMQFLWAMLVKKHEEKGVCLSGFVNSHPLVKAELLPLLKAQAEAATTQVPTQLRPCNIPEFQLMTKLQHSDEI